MCNPASGATRWTRSARKSGRCCGISLPGDTDLNDEEKRVAAAFGATGTPARFAEAANNVRFQLGQSDRFREGLERSSQWEAHIEQAFANLGLPPELAALPHVESSFDPTAYSKVGAAGLWQFMRGTGRRYLRIDDAVDERMDPFRATEAAAQLLDYNYRFLGTWPLALTAYNHGAAGMRRAADSLNTTDIVTILAITGARPSASRRATSSCPSWPRSP